MHAVGVNSSSLFALERCSSQYRSCHCLELIAFNLLLLFSIDLHSASNFSQSTASSSFSSFSGATIGKTVFDEGGNTIVTDYRATGRIFRALNGEQSSRC
jgi:hypothetical protein